MLKEHILELIWCLKVNIYQLMCARQNLIMLSTNFTPFHATHKSNLYKFSFVKVFDLCVDGIASNVDWV
jgi:hypothetical protein